MSAALLSVQDRVVAVLKECLVLRTDEISLSDDVVSDLGAESIDLCAIPIALEDEFDAGLFDEWLDGCQTVQDIIDRVISRLPEEDN